MATLARDYLANLGVSMQEALGFVVDNLNNPSEIYNTCLKFGVSNQMLAEIVAPLDSNLDASSVRGFFGNKGLDALALDMAYFNKLKNTTTLANYTSINDNLTLDDNDNYVDGGPGNDNIKGNGGNDVLLGGTGDDTIDGGRGADYIDGGSGADTLYGGSYSSTVWGHYEGNQWVPTYTEYDTSVNVIYGGGGADRLYGGYGNDILDGGDGADTIYGNDSWYSNNTVDNDLIYGRAGADNLYGEEGNDVIYGGDDNDYIDGGVGSDTLYGEGGDDRIYTGGTDNAVDTVFGGDGNDQIYISDGDSANGGAGNDVISFNAASTPAGVTIATIVAGEGADKISTYNLSESARLIIDLTETVQAKDDITSWDVNSGTVHVPMEIRGFNVKFDTFNLDYFDMYGATSVYRSAAGYLYGSTSYNYSQIITSPSTPYQQPSGTSGVDSVGKGFFVIQGASASASDTASAAAFIDAYGNNATYGLKKEHYFLINVGTQDSALYFFKDDTGADNNVVEDELTPVAIFTGVRTENYTTADLINVFV